MHKSILINDISLYFPNKSCFEHFSANVRASSRIAVIGRNGGGKTSLFKMLMGTMQPAEGEIIIPPSVTFGYVPQTVTEHDSLSGGERFNKALTRALALNPDVLLLDEPTNHLDYDNRQSLMRMLEDYDGTLIMISHDAELLNRHADTFWHIHDNRIDIFNGRYGDYFESLRVQRASMEKELFLLEKEKTAVHKELMKEQKRAKGSREHGEKQASQKRWAPIVAGGKKRQAQNTAGSKKHNINTKREDIKEKLGQMYIPEIILPKFSITPQDISQGSVLTVHNGAAGYDKMFLHNITLSVGGSERIAITGGNGSGKTTFINALLNRGDVKREGDWETINSKDIGYLDQHYSTLNPNITVIETIAGLMPGAEHARLRIFLNDFIFRKNEEVNAKVSVLSGGEKARLSLAVIAAKTPKLLILDEITNNVDMETKEHIIQVLTAYPGAIVAVSHERDFLEQIGITRFYDICKYRG